MTPKEIIVLMKMLDVTQASIAARLKITPPAVQHVIKGFRRNPRIRLAIAEALGRPVEQIWPPESKPIINDTEINHPTTKSKRKQERKKNGRKSAMTSRYQKAGVRSNKNDLPRL